MTNKASDSGCDKKSETSSSSSKMLSNNSKTEFPDDGMLIKLIKSITQLC